MSNKASLPGRKKNERVAAYVFSLPAMFLLIAFLVVPIVYTIRYSLFQYQIVRPDNIKFIGLQNYTKLFTDENFWLSLKNTVYFTVLVVPFQCVLALALAMLVSSKFLVSIGLEPINFLSNPKTAMNAIIFMSGWQGAGYQMMIFLAGLQGIPRDQYEAASVDGATKVQQFLYITLPGLKGTIKYVVMITMIQAMKLFTQPYVMTQGGPKNSTKTLVYYIYTQGFQQGNFGYACAVATVFFIIVVVMSLSMKKLIAATD